MIELFKDLLFWAVLLISTSIFITYLMDLLRTKIISEFEMWPIFFKVVKEYLKQKEEKEKSEEKNNE